jgi:hypothetical protein
LADLLCKEYAGHFIPGTDIIDPRGSIIVQRKHSTIAELEAQNILSDQDALQLRKFTTIRNPYDSLVSIWSKKKNEYAELSKADPNFFGFRIPGFMDDLAFIETHSFSDWIVRTYGPAAEKGEIQSLNKKHVAGCDEIIKFEQLQSDFDELMRKWNCPLAEISVLNKTMSRKRSYQEYYNEMARDVVAKVFRRDLETHGYAF